MDIRFDPSIFGARIEEIQNRLNHPESVLRRIGADMQKEVQLRFRNTTDPEGERWASLSIASTLERALNGRDTLRRGDKPLNDRGILKNSITWRSNHRMAQAGTNVPYAPTHQFGARRGTYGRTRRGRPIPWGDIPARAFMGFSRRQKEKYAQWVRDYIFGGE